ncbi:MAG: anthranilate phosphoribosyltransferase [Gemmatimonadales bacterium]|nr:anthranilate phosphoribosyltransferase [Gemmatimonadales bacterium]
MLAASVLDTLSRRSLDQTESFAAFTGLIAGDLTDIEIAALLGALKARGETPAEIAGAALALRRAALPFPKPDYPVADTCGTGGDGAGTVNISTASAFVAAAAGVRVAKHGNRASSSRCGSADLLEALGVRLETAPDTARRCLDQAGICFLFAPAYHPGVRRATGVRQTLRTRTVFNLLGPLANPAQPECQVMGVYAERLVVPLAETLGMLGCRDALVVHGSGMDEIALHGPTAAARLHRGSVQRLTLTPAMAGCAVAPVEALAGTGPEEGARWLRRLLAGHAPAAHLDAVALNSGAMLWIAGLATDLRQGADAARDILADGRALRHLDALIEYSHGA